VPTLVLQFGWHVAIKIFTGLSALVTAKEREFRCSEREGESLPQRFCLQRCNSLETSTPTWHVLSTALVNAGDWTGTEGLTGYSVGCQARSYRLKISTTY